MNNQMLLVGRQQFDTYACCESVSLGQKFNYTKMLLTEGQQTAVMI